MQVRRMIWLFVFCASITDVFSLFEDQIGKFDWRLQYIGKPRHVVFGTSGDKNGPPSRIFAITDQNVLAALSGYNGDIVWRHVFEQNENGRLNDLLLSEGDVITLGSGGQQITCWEKHRGTLRWSITVSNEYCETAKLVEYKSGSIAVLSPCGNVLSAVDRGGGIAWTIPLHKQKETDGVLWHDIAASGEEIVLLGERKGSSSVVVSVVSSAGQVVNTINNNMKYDPSKVAILSHPNRLVWLDVGSSTLNSLVLAGTTSSTSEPSKSQVPKTDNPAALDLKVYSHRHWTLMDRSSIYLPMKSSTDQKSVQEFQIQRLDGVTAGFVSSQEDLVYAAIANPSPRGGSLIQFYDTKSGNRMNEWDIVIPSTETTATAVDLYPFLKLEKGTNSAGVLIVGKDHSLSMLHHPGKIIWSRQEALASVLSVELLDLPLSEAQANIEEEFSTNGSILSMLTRRVTSQAIQLQRLILLTVNEALGLADLLGKSSEPFLASKTGNRAGERSVAEKEGGKKVAHLERDYFNLHKMIVLATAAGKLFGLDSANGGIIWQKYLPDITPFSEFHHHTMPFYVLRTTAHYPHPARCAVAGQHKTSGHGILVTFNPISGSDFEIVLLEHRVKQVFILPVVDEHELQGIGFITDDLKVLAYPSTVADIFSKSLQEKPFIPFLADELGVLNGYRIIGASSDEGIGNEKHVKMFRMEPVWKTILPVEKQGRIVSAVTKRFTEQVHSQGRVLGDRSVLYKYVNPNLVAVAAEVVDSSGKNHLNIHLVDAVTGDNIFTTVHRRVNGPYHIVHCENWIVYAYWNEKSRRNEITVLELYEGKEQANPAKFSSFNPPSSPFIMRQSYVFPQGIQALAVTDTEKGITSRHLLIAMPFGGILELPKMFLDPRRVMNPTPEEREEGLFPYIPELPIMTDQIMNYNQSVYNIRTIHAAPSGLESTSLIFAYGLDLYFTRVTPSGTFDILKDDFDHWFIGCVLLCLFLGSVITKRLARHRDVKLAWK